MVGGHKAYLFAFIDDHSRALPGYRWGHSEDTVRLEAALRHGLGARGIPRSIYVDNGSAFVAAPLLRACAVLGHPPRALHARDGPKAEARSNGSSARCATSSSSRSPPAASSISSR